MTGSVVGIGGGGFLVREDDVLSQERYLVSLLQPRDGAGARPRVIYLGTAAGDGERAQLRFLRSCAWAASR